jgi:Lysozyme like domain
LTTGRSATQWFDVSSLPAIAGVDSRIAHIRARLEALSPVSNGSDSRNLAVEPSASATPFDPFGSVYQLAMQQLGSSPTTYVPTSSALGTVDTGPRTEALSGQQVATMAFNAGFRGEDLVKVVAISKRESGWRPEAFNGNASTGDLSYGLMQINMKGSLGPARLAQLGLSNNEQLLDPMTNMNAAFKIYSASGNSLNAWGGYKGLSDTYGTDLASAQQIVSEAGLTSNV